VKNRLLAALLLVAASANAQEARYNSEGYSSVGTAYKVVSSTAVPVTSGTTVTKFTSDTVAAVYRLVCSQKCHISAPSGVVTPTVTVSHTALSGETPEYFVLDPRTNLAVTRNSTDGVLSITKMKR